MNRSKSAVLHSLLTLVLLFYGQIQLRYYTVRLIDIDKTAAMRTAYTISRSPLRANHRIWNLFASMTTGENKSAKTTCAHVTRKYLIKIWYYLKNYVRSCFPVRCIRRIFCGKSLVHVGLHVPANAGDTLLFPVVRKLIEARIGSCSWDLQHLRKDVDMRFARYVNRHARAVVIGGGGLFLSDTNRNPNSGWQWNCPVGVLEAIDVPIIVFAVGYNRFRGQEEFSDIFTRHLNLLAEKSAFFGIRNTGSIKALTRYLREDLKSKPVFQPCPTTLLKTIYDLPSVDPFTRGKRLAINVAADRSGLRFAGSEHSIYNAMAHSLKWAQQNGWRVTVLLHYRGDDCIIPYLTDSGVAFDVVDLEAKPNKAILDFYAAMPLTLGMRGHSQMIPFGVGNQIISLISHDKLGWFLDDIGHPEWGVDVASDALADKIIAKISYMYDNRDEVRSQTEAAQKQLLEITGRNLSAIQQCL